MNHRRNLCTLLSGVALLSLGALGACSSEDAAACLPGDEGCPCYPDGACRDSLSCLSDLCVFDPGASGGSSTGGTTGAASEAGDGAGGSLGDAGSLATGGTPDGGSSSATGGTPEGGSPSDGGHSAVMGGTSDGGRPVATGGTADGGSSAATGGTSDGGSSVATGGTSDGGSSAATGGTSDGGSSAEGGSASATGGTSGRGGGLATGGAAGVGGTPAGGSAGSAGTGEVTPQACVQLGFVGADFSDTSVEPDELVDWLSSRGATVTRIGATDILRGTNLDPLDVVIVGNMRARDTAYTSDDVDALESWVRGGGGLMTLVGYTADANDAAPADELLSPLGLGYSYLFMGPGILGTGPSPNVITGIQQPGHPTMQGIESLGFYAGYTVTGGGTALIVERSLLTLARADEVERGRVFAYGDEYVSLVSQWAAHPELDHERFWMNVINWLAEPSGCVLAEE